ncbi:MAG: hypothetical protein M3326_07135 [Actinomycetota bacterium]|nr:hypothetical protein [Actinomycetota bacterium]
MIIEGGDRRFEVSEGSGTWIVLLEAASEGDASRFDPGTVRAIVREMGDADGVALRAPHRIAVQVQIQADDVACALGSALARWRAAASESAPPGWHVVRAEVLTPEEFKRDCELG